MSEHGYVRMEDGTPDKGGDKSGGNVIYYDDQTPWKAKAKACYTKSPTRFWLITICILFFFVIVCVVLSLLPLLKMSVESGPLIEVLDLCPTVGSQLRLAVVLNNPSIVTIAIVKLEADVGYKGTKAVGSGLYNLRLEPGTNHYDEIVNLTIYDEPTIIDAVNTFINENVDLTLNVELRFKVKVFGIPFSHTLQVPVKLAEKKSAAQLAMDAARKKAEKAEDKLLRFKDVNFAQNTDVLVEAALRLWFNLKTPYLILNVPALAVSVFHDDSELANATVTPVKLIQGVNVLGGMVAVNNLDLAHKERVVGHIVNEDNKTTLVFRGTEKPNEQCFIQRVFNGIRIPVSWGEPDDSPAPAPSEEPEEPSETSAKFLNMTVAAVTPVAVTTVLNMWFIDTFPVQGTIPNFGLTVYDATPDSMKEDGGATFEPLLRAVDVRFPIGFSFEGDPVIINITNFQYETFGDVAQNIGEGNSAVLKISGQPDSWDLLSKLVSLARITYAMDAGSSSVKPFAIQGIDITKVDENEVLINGKFTMRDVDVYGSVQDIFIDVEDEVDLAIVGIQAGFTLNVDGNHTITIKLTVPSPKRTGYFLRDLALERGRIMDVTGGQPPNPNCITKFLRYVHLELDTTVLRMQSVQNPVIEGEYPDHEDSSSIAPEVINVTKIGVNDIWVDVDMRPVDYGFPITGDVPIFAIDIIRDAENGLTLGTIRVDVDIDPLNFLVQLLFPNPDAVGPTVSQALNKTHVPLYVCGNKSQTDIIGKTLAYFCYKMDVNPPEGSEDVKRAIQVGSTGTEVPLKLKALRSISVQNDIQLFAHLLSELDFEVYASIPALGVDITRDTRLGKQIAGVRIPAIQINNDFSFFTTIMFKDPKYTGSVLGELSEEAYPVTLMTCGIDDRSNLLSKLLRGMCIPYTITPGDSKVDVNGAAANTASNTVEILELTTLSAQFLPDVITAKLKGILHTDVEISIALPEFGVMLQQTKTDTQPLASLSATKIGIYNTIAADFEFRAPNPEKLGNWLSQPAAEYKTIVYVCGAQSTKTVVNAIMSGFCMKITLNPNGTAPALKKRAETDTVGMFNLTRLDLLEWASTSANIVLGARVRTGLTLEINLPAWGIDIHRDGNPTIATKGTQLGSLRAGTVALVENFDYKIVLSSQNPRALGKSLSDVVDDVPLTYYACGDQTNTATLFNKVLKGFCYRVKVNFPNPNPAQSSSTGSGIELALKDVAVADITQTINVAVKIAYKLSTPGTKVNINIPPVIIQLKDQNLIKNLGQVSTPQFTVTDLINLALKMEFPDPQATGNTLTTIAAETKITLFVTGANDDRTILNSIFAGFQLPLRLNQPAKKREISDSLEISDFQDVQANEFINAGITKLTASFDSLARIQADMKFIIKKAFTFKMSVPALGVDVSNKEKGWLIAKTATRAFTVVEKFAINIDTSVPDPQKAGLTLTDAVSEVPFHLVVTGQQVDTTILHSILKYFSYTMYVNDPAKKNTTSKPLANFSGSAVDLKEVSTKIAVALKAKIVLDLDFDMEVQLPDLGVKLLDKIAPSTILANTNTKALSLKSGNVINQILIDFTVPSPQATGSWASILINDKPFRTLQVCGNDNKQTVLNSVLSYFCYSKKVNDPAAPASTGTSDFDIPLIEIVQISNVVQLGFNLKPDYPAGITMSGVVPELGIDLTRDSTRAQTANVLMGARSRPLTLGATLSSVVQLEVPNPQGTGQMLTDLIVKKRMKVYACGTPGFSTVLHKVLENFCYLVDMNNPSTPKTGDDAQTSVVIQRVNFAGAESVGNGWAGVDIWLEMNKMYLKGSVPRYDFQMLMNDTVVFNTAFAAMTLTNSDKATTIKPHVMFQVPTAGGTFLQKKLNGLVADLASKKPPQNLITALIRGAPITAASNILAKVFFHVSYDLSEFFANATKTRTNVSGSNGLDLTKELSLISTTSTLATFGLNLPIDKSPVNFPISVGDVEVTVLTKPRGEGYNNPNFLRLATLRHKALATTAGNFTLHPEIIADVTYKENFKWTLHDLLMKPPFGKNVPIQVDFKFSSPSYKTFQFTWSGLDIPVDAIPKDDSGSGESKGGIMCTKAQGQDFGWETIAGFFEGDCTFDTSLDANISNPVNFDFKIDKVRGKVYYQSDSFRICIGEWIFKVCHTFSGKTRVPLGDLHYERGDVIRANKWKMINLPIDVDFDIDDCMRALYLGDKIRTYIQGGELCATLNKGQNWQACVAVNQITPGPNTKPTPKCT